jgi:hypothetical protein
MRFSSALSPDPLRAAGFCFRSQSGDSGSHLSGADTESQDRSFVEAGARRTGSGSSSQFCFWRRAGRPGISCGGPALPSLSVELDEGSQLVRAAWAEFEPTKTEILSRASDSVVGVRVP